MNARIIAAVCIAAATLPVARHRQPMSNRPPAAHASSPAEWTLREELRLGADPGADDDLLSVRGIVVSHSGSVFALDERVIKVFAPGTRVRRFAVASPAPPGDALGPPAAVGSIGDRLWVFQPPHLITVLDPAGTVLRRMPYRGEHPGQGAGRAREPARADSTFVSLLADGSLLRTMSPPGDDDGPPPARMYVLPLPATADTSTRSTTLLVRASADGEAIQGLEVLTGPWSDARVASPYGHLGTVPQPFQDHQLVGAGPGGTEVVVVERFATAPADRAAYSVIRFQAPSWKRTIHRFPHEPSAVTTADVDSAVARIVEGPGPGVSGVFLGAFPSRAAATAAVRSVLRRPTWHAPVTEIVVGSDRTVWLRERATNRWLAHTPDGRLAGSIRLPPGSRLMSAGDRTLWVTAPLPGGRDGQAVLVRYRIVDS